MNSPKSLPVAVIGSGPAGLMAAETLLEQGYAVELFEAMPALARKLLVAGQSGLNLTSSEPFAAFVDQYGEGRDRLVPYLRAFGPEQLRLWAEGLGIATFIGSTGRVFPVGMASGPLLDAWLTRLVSQGLVIHLQHRWCGWDDTGRLRMQTASDERQLAVCATIFALGGGSWPQLGSTGAWLNLFAARGLTTAPLRPANCGFDIAFSEHFRDRHQGRPIKNVQLSFVAGDGRAFHRRGELLVTADGLEGGLIYACSAMLRDTLARQGEATFQLDLCPDLPLAKVIDRLARPRGSRSTSNYLEKAVGLKGVKTGLLYEYVPPADFASPERLAAWIKALPIAVIAPRPLAEAISSAGGLCFSELDDALMLRALPGTFCAGEMLDWEAPTGGYLLTACLATGRAAGLGAGRWLRDQGILP